mgnify:CR=1 FL=1
MGVYMVVQDSGKITDELYLLGQSGMPVFFVDGEHPALIDAGFSCLGRLYVKQIKQITSKIPDYCLLTHVHFDHCGAVSVFKDNFPSMSICCSEKGNEILDKPNAIKLIKELNKEAKKYMGKQDENTGEMDDFKEFDVDFLLRENDSLQISSDKSVQVIETPGHTRDHICFYIPEKKILFSGEALGISNTTGYIHTEALVDFDLYMDSLEKLSKLEVDVLCLGHNHCYIGQDVRDYFENSRRYSFQFRDWVDACMEEEGGDIERVMQRIKAWEYDPVPDPKQPEGAYLLNLKAKIEAIRNRKYIQ